MLWTVGYRGLNDYPFWRDDTVSTLYTPQPLVHTPLTLIYNSHQLFVFRGFTTVFHDGRCPRYAPANLLSSCIQNPSF